MKRYLSAVFVFGSLTILMANIFHLPYQSGVGKDGFKQNEISTVKNDSAAQSVKENFGKLPLIFEENRGQTDERVKYLSRAPGYTLFLTESAAVMSLRPAKAKKTIDIKSDAQDKQSFYETDNTVLRITTVNGNSPSKIEGQDEQIGKSNYLLGEDSRKWVRDVPNF
ncbi:MAG TPA: hypothetical protein VGB00_11865, partial [Pyrinomonadaceae bacterium]